MAKGVAKYKIFNSKLTAIVSISMVLFLLGLVSMGLMIEDKLSSYVKENYIVSLTIRDGSSDKDVQTTLDILKGKEYTKEVKYISKEDALKELTEEMGEDPVDFLGYNPLFASFEIKLKSEFAEAAKIDKIAKELGGLSVLKEIRCPKQLMEKVNNNINRLSFLLLLFSAVLLFISFVLINNTVRLLIYSDRFLIHTMKLVGATRSFIRRPYMKTGVVIGLLAALFAIGYVLLMSYLLDDKLRLFIDFNDMSVYAVMFATILVSGIVITLIATYLSVNKFLNKHEGDLYYI
ncbi:MAG: permease-like cell division protein FtsX [Paludibacteraceae bacterium]|nr:permease-like cell division protein FtsX [Paludibacteraceae bacterium]